MKTVIEKLVDRDLDFIQLYNRLIKTRRECFKTLKSEQWLVYKDWRWASTYTILRIKPNEGAPDDQQSATLYRSHSAPPAYIKHSDSEPNGNYYMMEAHAAYKRLMEKSAGLSNEWAQKTTITVSAIDTCEPSEQSEATVSRRHHSTPKNIGERLTPQKLPHPPLSGLWDFDPRDEFPTGLNMDYALWLDCVSGRRLISNQMIYCEQCTRFHILGRDVKPTSFLQHLHGWYTFDPQETLRNNLSIPMLSGLSCYVQSFLGCVARALILEADTTIHTGVIPDEDYSVVFELVLHCLGGLVRDLDGKIPEDEDMQLLQAYTSVSERYGIVEE